MLSRILSEKETENKKISDADERSVEMELKSHCWGDCSKYVVSPASGKAGHRR